VKLHKLIKGNSKAVCLWSDISPYPAVLEIVTHLENGVILNNKKEQNYKINNKIYDKFYAKPVTNCDNLDEFKLIIFWRNPYYRLFSEYLETHSPNDTHLEFERSFSSYIEHKTEDCTQEEVNKIKEWILTHFEKKVSSLNTFVALLPNRISSTLSLFYDTSVVERIYKFIWRKQYYDKIKHLHEKTNNIFNNIYRIENNADKNQIKQISAIDIHKSYKYPNIRTVFSDATLTKIDFLIKNELEFFRNIEINFDL